MLTMWPINVRPEKPNYLFPKYGTLERIVLARPVKEEYTLPKSPEDVFELLSELPEGFAKQFQFGLGLHWENRFICEAVASLPGISILYLHGGGSTFDAKIDPPFFIMGLGRYQELRKEIARASARHQRAAREEKEILAHQWLLHAADKEAFPRKRRKLRPDAIAEMAGVGGAQTKLSKRDRISVVKLVNENAEESQANLAPSYHYISRQICRRSKSAEQQSKQNSYCIWPDCGKRVSIQPAFPQSILSMAKRLLTGRRRFAMPT